MTNIQKLRDALENAPLIAKTNPEIAGWYGLDWQLCAHCAARIMARGCALPKPTTIIWTPGIVEHYDGCAA